MSRSPFHAATRRPRRPTEDLASPPFLGLTPQGRSPRHLHFRFDHVTSQGKAPPAAPPSQPTQSLADQVDGIPVEQLRKLVTKELIVQPKQAVFYANIIYAKTKAACDALLLAHAFTAAGKSHACLRVLEEAALLHQERPWDAALLACQALAAAQEWNTLIEVAQDACRTPLYDSAAHEPIHQTTSSQHLTQQTQLLSNTIEDSDILSWQALKSSILADDMGEVHPLARILCLRGEAYYRTGNGPRAAVYWKLALQMDCQCQEAYQNLLQHFLLTPTEAHELIAELVDFPPQQQYLQAIYLSQIELTPQENTKQIQQQQQQQQHYPFHQDPETADLSKIVAEAGVAPELSFANHLDASSIQMSSPIAQIPHFQTPSLHHHHDTNMPIDVTKEPHFDNDVNNKNQAILNDVDVAFRKLWDEYKLQEAPQVLAMAARRAYRRYDWKAARQHCQALAQIDPSVPDAAFCYISSLVILGDKRLLFRIAHEWVEADPKAATSWFAVGAYYYACERYHVAQRHFCRATRLDPSCHEAWIAFGCSFAACDESDQSLASFRAAQRLSPGEHMSLLYMGMEYVRTNHLTLASYFLQSALGASGGDPLCLNEMGVLHAHKGNHQEAIVWFQRALLTVTGANTLTDAMELCHDVYWEPTLFNLGHSFRKSRQFDQAASCYIRCIALCPDKHSTYCALAFVYQLMDACDKAVELYHKALGVSPSDPFSTEMLGRALQQSMKTSLILTDDTNLPPAREDPSFLFSPKVVGFSVMDQSSMSEGMDIDMSLIS